MTFKILPGAGVLALDLKIWTAMLLYKVKSEQVSLM